jgi:hypothetical protein
MSKHTDHKHIGRWLICCAGVAAFGLGACATTSSSVRVDKGEADLSKCQTFDWLPSSNEAASFTEQRVRSEVLTQLQAKGYTQSTDKPDCRITFVLATQEQPKSRPSVGVGAGGGSRGVGGGIGVSLPIGRKNQQSGTFTLDVVDVAKNQQIWSGSLDTSFAAQELTEDEARNAVRKVLAEFPDRVTPNQ